MDITEVKIGKKRTKHIIMDMSFENERRGDLFFKKFLEDKEQEKDFRKAVMKAKQITADKHREMSLKTNLIWALVDVCDSIVAELEQESIKFDLYRFDVKRNLKGLKHHTELFRKEFNNAVRVKSEEETETKQSDFGEDSDRLKEIIYKEIGL